MTRKSPPQDGPELHTAVITDVPSMWQKLAWDVDQFDEIQRSYPDLAEPLGFAALNVCIAAASLRDWAVGAVLKLRRSQGHRPKEREVIDHIHQHVTQQRMCEAIANTAKHSRLTAGQWPDGSVRMTWHEASEDEPPGYVLRHIHADGVYESLALNAFGNLVTNWWGELQNLGFAFPGGSAQFEWKQRKLQAMFDGRGNE